MIYEDIKFQKNFKNKNFFFGNLFKSIKHDELIITYNQINEKNKTTIYSLVNNEEIVKCLIKSIISLFNVYFLIRFFFEDKKEFKIYWTRTFFYKEKLKNIFLFHFRKLIKK